METKTKFAAIAFIIVGLQVAGCSHIKPVPERRNPYHSDMLNADFTSAYPRSTNYDPFGGQPATARRQTPAQRQTASAASSSDSRSEHDERVATARAPARSSERIDEVYSPRRAAGYISTVYEANNTPTVDANVAEADIVDIYRYTQRHGTIYHSTRPAVGDLVFFHNTYDRNGDGRNNDWYTHIGLVESVNDQGGVSILSYIDGRVSRTHLNLERSDISRDADGSVINTTMRLRRDDDAPYTQYQASELFAGFGSLLGDLEELVVIDNWQPGMNVALGSQ